MANLLKSKKIKQLSLNLYTDIQVKLDQAWVIPEQVTVKSYIGRGLIQLTGKANYPRYGKLAGLVKEELKDPALNIWCRNS